MTQELKNTHTEQMTRLHFKHQTECDLLEDMRYEHPCYTHARFIATAKRTEEYAHQLPDDLKPTDVHCSVKWTLPLTKGNSLGVQEGWHGKEKRGGGVLSYFSFG